MTEAILVMVSCRSADEARSIAEALVEGRLAAGATLVAEQFSIYHWKGEVQRTPETILLLKTRTALFERLRARVRMLHSYEVPEIVALPIVAGDKEYLDWLAAETPLQDSAESGGGSV